MNLPKELFPRFCRLALANSLSNIAVPLASLVDASFLGHLDELHHLVITPRHANATQECSARRIATWMET